MINLIDFSNCPDGYREYSGSDQKISIQYGQDKYMLKFPEHITEKKSDLQTSYANNVLSEYIGSHIIASTGLPTHETLLGTYNGQFAVACKDFTGDGYRLHEFAWFMRNMYKSSDVKRIPTYRQLYEVMEHHPLLSNIRQEAIQRYWDTFVVDALIGNFDRHKSNWGYLVNEDTGDIKLAPIYDCGSSIYPGLSEKDMAMILGDKAEIERRMYQFPKPALNRNDNPRREDKFGYLEMLSSGIDKNCTEALKRIYPRIDMMKINQIIETIPILSDQRIEFYEKMLSYRKDLIIDKALNIIQNRKYTNQLHTIAENIRGISGIHEIQIDTTDEKLIVIPTFSLCEIQIDSDTKETHIIRNGKELSALDAIIECPSMLELQQKLNSALSDKKIELNRDDMER